MDRDTTGEKRGWAGPALLGLLVFSLYWPALFYGFVNYDDLDVVVNNTFIRSLDLDGLRKIFTHFSVTSYYPVRTLSLAVDFALWGLEPQGYHLTNVLFHLANVFLLYALVIRLNKGKDENGKTTAFFAAALFAVYPVAVDTVAWIPGREEVLTLFFILFSLHLCVWRQNSGHRLLFSVLLAYAGLAACLSNILGAVLPGLVVLFLVVFAGEKKASRLLAQTWYLWLISLLAVYVKIVSAGVMDFDLRVVLFPHVPTALGKGGLLIERVFMQDLAAMGAGDRALLVISLFGKNLIHSLFPLSLPILYPNQGPGSLFSWPVMAGIFSMACFALAVWFSRKRPFVLFGLFWFLVSLVPSLQIFPSTVWQAERFLYIPIAGLCMALAGAALNFGRPSALPLLKRRLALWVWVGGLSAIAMAQVGVWSDPLNLHKTSVARNPDHFLAHQYLAREYQDRCLYGLAVDHHIKAVNLNPKNNELWIFAIEALYKAGRNDQGDQLGRQGINQDRSNPERYNNWALALGRYGRYAEAARVLERALKIDPDNPMIQENLGTQYLMLGRIPEAEKALRACLARLPQRSRARFQLGLILESKDDKAGAAEQYRLAIEWAPAFLPPYKRLAGLGELDKASY